jgi:GntR family transcriptional regulator
MTPRSELAARRATAARARRTLNQGDAPLYVRLAGAFRRRIEDGAWPVDAQIPTLEQLVAETGASRVTVRQALGRLEQAGLLARFRGRGTFVLQRPERDAWCELETDWQSLVRAHEDVTTELLKCEPAARVPQPSHPGGRSAPAYQFIQRRHRRDGVPYLIGYAYLDARLWQRLSAGQIENLPLLRVLNDLPGLAIGRAAQTMIVSSVDFEVAGLLEVPVDAPVVIVDRSVFDASGELALETRGYYRSEFVKLTMRLR